MDERDRLPNGEIREEDPGSTDPETEEEKNRAQLPLLAAYCDSTISVEAAEQLVSMAEDASIPVHTGDDLPKADREALLQKVRKTQRVP